MTCRNVKALTLAGLVLVGSSGLASAGTDYTDVVRDMEGQIVRSSNGNCVRTQWEACCDACAPQRAAQWRERRTTDVLTREERTVYFKFNRANLTPEAKQRLDTLADALKSDLSVKEAKIIGYADRIGSVAYNERLSQKRAQTVSAYLIAQGYTNARVTETRWVGKSEPSTNCPATEARPQLIECLQNDRRVEVEIEYLPEEQISNAR
jgi:outer membrane protein OmpA-like peptidoglycan-associated protein